MLDHDSDIRMRIRDFPDYPEPGIIFRDVTSLLASGDGLTLAVDALEGLCKDLDFDVIAGTESRGFLFGAPLADRLKKPFLLVRKKGKLPGRVLSETYELEYGAAQTIELHADDIRPGQRVLVVDDLLATGGTANAVIRLIQRAGGVIAGCLFLMELAYCKGRDAIDPGIPVRSAVVYEE